MSRNFLQSPYFFMVCNLCDANLDRPGQLSAAQQGEGSDIASTPALTGTLVSSLHRLKDNNDKGLFFNSPTALTALTWNIEGGFFVFPDVTVRIEGTFRLRFVLFEMLK